MFSCGGEIEFMRLQWRLRHTQFRLAVPRSDRFSTGHPDGPRGDHQEPGPGAEPAEGEDQQARGGEGGSAQPEPCCQRTAQTASAQTRTGTFNLSLIPVQP